jgi:hypothetical protein
MYHLLPSVSGMIAKAQGKTFCERDNLSFWEIQKGQKDKLSNNSSQTRKNGKKINHMCTSTAVRSLNNVL